MRSSRFILSACAMFVAVAGTFVTKAMNLTALPKVYTKVQTAGICSTATNCTTVVWANHPCNLTTYEANTNCQTTIVSYLRQP